VPVDLKIWVKKHSQSSIFENKNLKNQIIIKPGMFGLFFFLSSQYPEAYVIKNLDYGNFSFLQYAITIISFYHSYGCSAITTTNGRCSHKMQLILSVAHLGKSCVKMFPLPKGIFS
jgi:hypothetical protein